MAGDPLWINASAGAPAFNANEMRQAMALALMYDGRNMGGRKGVRPGGNQLQVSYAAPTITVQPGLCYLDPALTTPQGGYWVAIPAAETHTLTPADATNPRKDIVIARVYDHDEDSSGLRLARTEYLVGTPNPSPSEPAVPASAIKLALLDVPATPGAVVVTDRRPWTVAAGGILPVAAAGDIAAAVEGRYRDRLDTNQLERDTGAAWETVADPAAFKAWSTWALTGADWTSTGTAPALGDGTILGAYRKIGRTVDVWMVLLWGSTTTGGTGNWRIPLPFAPVQGSDALSAYAEDASAGFVYPATARVQSTPPYVKSIGAHSATGAIGLLAATHPFTWAVNDRFVVAGTYQSLT